MSAERHCSCGHSNRSHSARREDDFACMVEGCGCQGWDEIEVGDVVSAADALKDAPDTPPHDPAVDAELIRERVAAGPTAHVSKHEHVEELARVEERLTAMLFLMMRDVMPAGHVGQLVESVSSDDFDFHKSELEPLARRMARGLMGAKLAVREKHVRDWVDRMPERIRQSPHLGPVLDEIERQADQEGVELTYNAGLAARVRDEVVARQRKDRDDDVAAAKTQHEQMVGGRGSA